MMQRMKMNQHEKNKLKKKRERERKKKGGTIENDLRGNGIKRKGEKNKQESRERERKKKSEKVEVKTDKKEDRAGDGKKDKKELEKVNLVGAEKGGVGGVGEEKTKVGGGGDGEKKKRKKRKKEKNEDGAQKGGVGGVGEEKTKVGGRGDGEKKNGKEEQEEEEANVVDVGEETVKKNQMNIKPGKGQKKNLDHFFPPEGGEKEKKVKVEEIVGQHEEEDVELEKVEEAGGEVRGRKASKIKVDFFSMMTTLGEENEEDTIEFKCVQDGCGWAKVSARIPALHCHLITDHRDLYMRRVMSNVEAYGVTQVLTREVRVKIQKFILDRMSEEVVEELCGVKWDWDELEGRKQNKNEYNVPTTKVMETRRKKQNVVLIENILGDEDSGLGGGDEGLGQKDLLVAKVELESLPTIGEVPEDILFILDGLLQECTASKDWGLLDGGLIMKGVKAADEKDQRKLQDYMQGVV
jgi:hypothetical protein